MESTEALDQALPASIQAWLDDEKEELAIGYLVERVADQTSLPIHQQKQARISAAVAFSHVQRWNDALELLDPCLPPAFDELELLFLFVELLARSGRPDAAYSWIEQMLQRKLPEVSFLRVLIYWSIAAERPDLCRMYLDQLSHCPDAAKMRVLLGADLLAAEANHQAAVDILEAHLPEFGSSRRYRLRLVEAYQSALMTEAALAELESSGRLFGFEGHIRRGLIELATSEPALTRAWQLLEATEEPLRDRLYFHQCGVVCFYRRQWDEAENYFRMSLQLASQPDRETIVMLSELMRIQGDYQKSLTFLERCFETLPHDSSLEFALAYDHLSLHQWSQGWKHYESRIKMDQAIFPMGLSPNWSGESLAGKRVLVLCEQGLGDVIMCASQLRMLDSVVADWCVIGFPQLRSLFEQSFGQGHFVCELSESQIADFDVRIGMCSLPGAFQFGQANNINPPPCLSVDESDVTAWNDRLKLKVDTPLAIGFTWFGGGNALLRRRRSLELEQLLPLFKLPGITWVSLQYGGDEVEEELLRFSAKNKLNILSYPDTSSDLYQQAALLKALDLTISVQQTVVHVAGSVGAKAWALLPTAPEWRYGVVGDSMPWYRSVRLFRQREAFHWDELISKVRSELVNWLS